MIIRFINVLISMANFTNSNQQIIDHAHSYPCLYEDVYISDLKVDEILISYDPSFMQNSNGMVIGIDSRFTDFYVIDKNQYIIKSLKLEWIDDCTENVSSKQVNDNNFLPFLYVFLFISLLIIVIVYLKRRRI